jgi:hypothetical protein
MKYHFSPLKISVGRKVEKLGDLYTASGNVK